ncbi:HNH endonuclease [Clostridium algoriphilum]|uniref:HNH endonuclease n=1 Tax=Clostridium algoriphilum TaxID=198347 RepID=UPI001CF3107A|nr:HNH endonuclease [Clostridium algoriphilum]MCB2295929.1 HNH endonuclease [Clostridium algoriphilum]
MSISEIRLYISNVLQQKKLAGEITCTLIAGDLQKELGIVNATPSVCDAMTKPWKRDERCKKVLQIQISPIIELRTAISFKLMFMSLNLFKNYKTRVWDLQGTNIVREINIHDFNVLLDDICKAGDTQSIEYIGLLKDNIPKDSPQVDPILNNVCINNTVPKDTIVHDVPAQSIPGMSSVTPKGKLNDVTEGPTVNETIQSKINRIKRNQRIIKELKDKYSNKCQICGFSFKEKNSGYYSEGHHMNLLSKGGVDLKRNVVILCANHHRMFHYADVEVFDIVDNKRKILINNEMCYIKYI